MTYSHIENFFCNIHLFTKIVKNVLFKNMYIIMVITNPHTNACKNITMLIGQNFEIQQ